MTSCCLSLSPSLVVELWQNERWEIGVQRWAGDALVSEVERPEWSTNDGTARSVAEAGVLPEPAEAWKWLNGGCFHPALILLLSLTTAAIPMTGEADCGRIPRVSHSPESSIPHA